MFQQLLNLKQAYVEGLRKDVIAGKAAAKAGEYYPTVLASVPGVSAATQQIRGVRDTYQKELNKLGVSFKETPVQAAGALTGRLLTDLTNDGTRGIYWRYNHPLAVLGAGVEAAIGKEAYRELGPLKTGLIGSAITIPATALAGAYDLTNPGELFRPKGFAQAYAEEGAEDRRETSQPTGELFERFFLGRTGRPLKYETAKEDIPSLTPERYGNYLRNYYQDKGFLGVVKATPENLQGVPEARVLGYPVTIPAVTTALGGLAGAGVGIRTAPLVKNSFKRGLAGALAGAGSGAILGNLANTVLAAKPAENQLPTTAQYEALSADRI